MKIVDFGAREAMSFAELDFTVNDTITVITGPNGSGKTSLARVIDIVARALRGCGTGDWNPLTSEYGEAGRFGASRWSVRLGVRFDTDSERRLIDDWVRACHLTVFGANFDEQREQMRGLLAAATDLGTAELFTAGSFVVEHDDRLRQPWLITWQTTVPGKGRSAATRKPAAARLRLDSTNTLSMDDAPATRASLEQELARRLKDPSTRARKSSSGRRIPGRKPSFPTLRELISAGSIDLLAGVTGTEREPDAVQRLMDALELSVMRTHRNVGFGQLAAHLLDQAVCVTANHRLPPTLIWNSDHLRQIPDLDTGEGLGLALYQDKNGDAAQRVRFRRTQHLFAELTFADLLLDVTARGIAGATEGAHDVDGERTAITPIIHSDGADVPLHLSGAGRIEAAYLSAVLARDWACLLLDEPATNLSASAQHRVARAIRARKEQGSQTLLITHSGHPVPANDESDLASIVRLTRGRTATTVHRPGNISQLRRRLGLLHSVDVRDAVFADGVLLVEGGTEYELLSIWLMRDVTPPLLLIPVNGQGRPAQVRRRTPSTRHRRPPSAR